MTVVGRIAVDFDMGIGWKNELALERIEGRDVVVLGVGME